MKLLFYNKMTIDLVLTAYMSILVNKLGAIV